MRSDPALRRDLETARALGIPHRRLLGWEPTTYTVTRDNGVTVTKREPEWDAWEAALMAALHEVEQDTCPGCGQPLSESLHVDGQPDPDYVDTYVECVGCRVRETTRARHEHTEAVRAGDTRHQYRPDPEAWRKHIVRTRADARNVAAKPQT